MRWRCYECFHGMRQGACATCSDFGICKGNSLHLWDAETGGPKLCHMDLLRRARAEAAGAVAGCEGTDAVSG